MVVARPGLWAACTGMEQPRWGGTPAMKWGGRRLRELQEGGRAEAKVEGDSGQREGRRQQPE